MKSSLRRLSGLCVEALNGACTRYRTIRQTSGILVKHPVAVESSKAGGGGGIKAGKSKYSVPAQATVVSAASIVAYLAVGIILKSAKVDWSLGARITIGLSAFLTATRCAQVISAALMLTLSCYCSLPL